MTVLDASALVAPIHDEAGSDVVAPRMSGETLGTVKLPEVVGTLVDADIDVSRLRDSRSRPIIVRPQAFAPVGRPAGGGDEVG